MRKDTNEWWRKHFTEKVNFYKARASALKDMKIYLDAEIEDTRYEVREAKAELKSLKVKK